eukprot:scaffold3.g6578.t1
MVRSDPANNLSVWDANSVWVKSGLTLQHDFQAALQSEYQAQAKPLTDAGPVNAWVKEATAGKLSSVVSLAEVANALLLLANAVYFKGQWLQPFQRSYTFPQSFARLDGSLQKEVFLRPPDNSLQFATFPSASTPSVPCMAVKLPYQGGAYSAIALAPNSTLSTSGPLMVASTASPAGTPDVPFEIPYSASLQSALAALSPAPITAPFAAPDFTLIAADGSGTPRALQVDGIEHKTRAYAKMDELDTEATAATIVQMLGAAMPPPKETPQVLSFAAPYAFFMVHDPTGAAVFASEIYAPEEWSDALECFGASCWR